MSHPSVVRNIRGLPWITVASLLASGAAADWYQSPGIILSNGGENLTPVVASDGYGGAYFVWSRSGTLYVKRVDRNGGVVFGPLPVSRSISEGQWNPVIVPDCGHGIFVAWEDGRNQNQGYCSDIFAQHINDDGTQADADKGISIAPNCQVECAMAISETLGVEDGAYLVWEVPDARQPAGKKKIYVQKAIPSSQCGRGIAVAFTAARADSNGVAVTPACLDPVNQLQPAVVSDLAGGAVVAWEDQTISARGIYGQHLGSEGAPDAAWGNCGVRISKDTLGTRTSPRIASDGQGGAFVVWKDSRNPPAGEWDIYAAWLRGNGLVTEFAVYTGRGEDSDPEIIPDGSGGAIVVWQHIDPTFESDIYCQRITTSGVSWNQHAVVCDAPGGQKNPRLASDGNGGAVIVWQDERPDPVTGADQTRSPDIYLQCVSSNGTVAARWLATRGHVLSNSALAQTSPHVIATSATGLGDAISVWVDANTPSPGISAETVQGACVAVEDVGEGPGVRVQPGGPNPFRSSIRFTLVLPARGDVELQVFDLQGRKVRTLAHGRYEAGVHAFTWDGGSDRGVRAAPGMYVARTRVAGAEWRQKLVHLR